MSSRALLFAENIITIFQNIYNQVEEFQKHLETAIMGKQPDVSCVYTEFEHPGRNIVDDKNRESVSSAWPSSIKDFISPLHVKPADFPYSLEEYQKAMCNQVFILGAIICISI